MIKTISYTDYEKGLPQEGNVILGQTNDNNVFVYQAFNNQIADFAIANHKFGGPHYSFSRMTWIKPNFLWMMFRSGWAEKENQNRILAIEITLKSFLGLLEKGVLTSYDESFASQNKWKEQLHESEVRIQWDPDHGPLGEKLKRRAVQIGIKGDTLKQLNTEAIQSITDITSFVEHQKQNLHAPFDKLNVAYETIIEMPPLLKTKFSIR